MCPSALDILKNYTTIVTDTGIIENISKYKPQDATTNPSLILAAINTGNYNKFLKDAVTYSKSKGSTPEEIQKLAFNRIIVNFGAEILKLIPGRVSTEVDAQYSFDKEATIKNALKIIDMYKELGIDKERVLIKIASTWEGIEAAKVLEEKYGVHCNLTLLFSLAQAIACAQANVTLISPFVGRILDWYKTSTGKDYTPAEDPGVVSVKEIFYYYKKHGYKTIIMGASFRNVGEIEELAGIDFLTISPKLLEELSTSDKQLSKKLNVDNAKHMVIPKIEVNEEKFHILLKDNKMASEKLDEGIKNFTDDGQKLHTIISKCLEESE